MEGVYGYNGYRYWIKIMVNGVQVDSKFNLTKSDLIQIFENNSFVSWSKDY